MKHLGRAFLGNERGSTVFFVVVLLSILAMMPVGIRLIELSQKETKQQLSTTAQADNVARAGLIDAVSWFRRQTPQPVRSLSDPVAYPYPDAAFYPRVSTITALSDTIDEAVGLVKEYQLAEGTGLWARYEVLRQTSNNVADPATHNARAVHDITDKRVEGYSAGEGLCWSLESVGYVYRLRDPNVAFNVAPNQVVAKSRMATEIRRLTMTLPLNAAVIVNNRSNVTLNANGRITGGAFCGLGYYTGSSGPTVSGGQYTGTPNRQDIDGAGVNGSITTQNFFGLTEKELKLMADYSVANLSSLPVPYPSMAVVFIENNVTFNSSRQLRGGGLLYVKGNLTLDAGSNTLFSGLIFVTGNATVNGPALISGSLAVQGSLTMNGSGDVAEVQYDDGILNSARQQIGQYRENKASYHTFSVF